MQVLITHGNVARTRVLQFSRWQLLVGAIGFFVLLMFLAGVLYHVVFLKAAREGWPVVSQIVKLVTRDEFAQRDRFMRENLDAMARKLGEMQAKLVELEALGERVSGLAGVNITDLRAPAGQGGALVEGRPLGMQELEQMLAELDHDAGRQVDVLTVLESRLTDQKARKLMVPSQQPLAQAPVGSGFGWRIDPFTGHSALHTGLDFEGPTGTPILAAAGGVVVRQEMNPAYGNMVEIDHGNGLVTRYAHASRVFVKVGDLVKRGQQIAAVGTTGRSTGPHLHFEVLVQGVPQDPRKFLSARGGIATAGIGPSARR